MTRVIGYVRVSKEESDKGNGLSLPAQESAIRAEIERRGWELVEIVSDDGYSAKDLKRPGIERVLELVDQDVADTVVVSRLDRLSRSLLDFAALMERSRSEGWYIVALDLAVDTTTPAGEIMANVLATFAQYERRLIGQRTRDALAIKKAQGVRLGRPVLVPEEVAGRIQMEREKGYTLREIAEGLTADGIATVQGGVRWYPSTVRAVLQRGVAQVGAGMSLYVNVKGSRTGVRVWQVSGIVRPVPFVLAHSGEPYEVTVQ